jgi:class 3 adenylate cyclase
MPQAPGTLVIADISGYTRYIAGTEQEHSVEILAELLGVIYRSFEGRLSIDQIEGDAICATTEHLDGRVLEWIRDCFGAYHRRVRDITTATTCPCRACASVGDLGLKFFAHRGSFSRQEIGSRVQLFGSDVNLVHRLTKNSVPLREYVYVSEPTFADWSTEDRQGFVALPQTYDLGVVEGSYRDLADIRAGALREAMSGVDATTARWHLQEELAAPIDTAWRLWTDPNVMQLRLRADSVTFVVPGVRGTYVGGEFHCHHGNGQSSSFRILSAEPPREMTVRMALPGVAVVYMTDRLRPLGGDKTLWDCWIGWPEADGVDSNAAMQFLDQFRPVMVGGIRDALRELTAPDALKPVTQR